jgi:hypothetical protein
MRRLIGTIILVAMGSWYGIRNFVPRVFPVVEASTPEVLTPSSVKEITQLVKKAAHSSDGFAALPESDQKWVIERAIHSLKVGQVSVRDISKHLDELSSVRIFAVLEKEEPYGNSPKGKVSRQ